MAGAARGFLLVEVLLVIVVLGVGLGGLSRLVASALAAEGEATRRMRARLEALSVREGEAQAKATPGAPPAPDRP